MSKCPDICRAAGRKAGSHFSWPRSETGYVQPGKSELRKIRGVNSIYHNNGIQTWHLHKNGEVENVEVSS